MALLQISEPGKSQNPHEKKYFIGIDLGTTNSLVAVYRNGSASVLKNCEDNELFPSVVTYEKKLYEDASEQINKMKFYMSIENDFKKDIL